jgi:hypothetical protein
VGVINLKTHVYVVKLPKNHESGLRFYFLGTQGTSRDPTGFRVPQKNGFFGIKYMFPWLNYSKKTNPTSVSAFSRLTGC